MNGPASCRARKAAGRAWSGIGVLAGCYLWVVGAAVAVEAPVAKAPTVVRIGNFENRGLPAGRFAPLQDSLRHLVKVGLLGSENVEIEFEEGQGGILGKAAGSGYPIEAQPILVWGNFVEYRGSVLVEVMVKSPGKDEEVHLSKVLEGSRFYADLDGLIADLRRTVAGGGAEIKVRRILLGCFSSPSKSARNVAHALAAGVYSTVTERISAARPIELVGAVDPGDPCQESEIRKVDAVLRGTVEVANQQVVISPILELNEGGVVLRLAPVRGVMGRFVQLEAALVDSMAETLNAAVRLDGLWETALWLQRRPGESLAAGRVAMQTDGAQDLAATLLERALVEEPESPEAHYQLGLARIAQHRSRDALAQLEAAHRLDQQSPKILTALGDALILTRDRRKAIDSYSEALARGADRVNVSLKLSEAYELDENIDQAIEVLEGISRGQPVEARVLNRLADLDRRRGRSDAAMEQYRLALTKEPGNEAASRGLNELVMNRARELIDKGSPVEALTVLDEVMQRAPSAEMYAWYLFALNNAERFDAAVETGDRAIKAGRVNGSIENNVAYALEKLHRPKEALEHYRHGLSLEPNSSVLISNEADLLGEMGDFKEAEELLQGAVARNPSDMRLAMRSAELFADYGKFDKALTALEAAGGEREAKRQGELYRYYLTCANVFDSQRMFPEAIHWNDLAISVDPQRWDAYNNKAFDLGEAGRYSEALEAAAAALTKKSTAYQPRNHQGYSLYRSGKRDEGKKLVTEVVEAHPDYANAHFNLARILANEGDQDGAAMHAVEAIRLGPFWVREYVRSSPDFEAARKDPRLSKTLDSVAATAPP